MTRSTAIVTRQERRLAEREGRRDQKRDRRQRSRAKASGWSLTSISLAALAVGLIAVVAIAVIKAPPPAVDLNEPAFFTPPALAQGMTLGSADAPVTLELWSDFQCPYCANFTDTIEPPIISDYVAPGKVKLVYRDRAFLGSESVAAATAARAAGASNLFWQYHDYLFANQFGEQAGTFNQARLEAIATAVGLDLVTFRAGQGDPAIRQAVSDEASHGASIGVQATPTLIIDGQIYEGSLFDYSAVKAAIDQALGE